jgi:hypothetical protein
MPIWIVLPGALAFVGGVVMTHVGAHRGSTSMALTGIRLRFLGIAMLLFLMGGWILVSGLGIGLDLSQVVIGLVLIGFGGLWLYARGGIGPKFPAA